MEGQGRMRGKDGQERKRNTQTATLFFLCRCNLIFPTLLKNLNATEGRFQNSLPLRHHTTKTLTEIKEDMLLTVMDYLFQAGFKSLYVGFYSVLK